MFTYRSGYAWPLHPTNRGIRRTQIAQLIDLAVSLIAGAGFVAACAFVVLYLGS